MPVSGSELIDALSKLGTGGLVGYLFGLFAVWWIEPTTGAGAVLLVIVFITLGMISGNVVHKLLVWLFSRKNRIPTAQLLASTPIKVAEPEPVTKDTNGGVTHEGEAASDEGGGPGIGDGRRWQKGR